MQTRHVGNRRILCAATNVKNNSDEVVWYYIEEAHARHTFLIDPRRRRRQATWRLTTSQGTDRYGLQRLGGYRTRSRTTGNGRQWDLSNVLDEREASGLSREEVSEVHHWVDVARPDTGTRGHRMSHTLAFTFLYRGQLRIGDGFSVRCGKKAVEEVKVDGPSQS